MSSICQRLDGIPLAIELAAARVRTMAPERIAAQLDDRFRLLTGGARTLLPRRQTLLASVAWSETLLEDAERNALRRLGVFVGGFSLEAAESVFGAFDDTDRYEVLDLVGRLVDKSLVALDEVSGRYRMLETIRSFALARLLDAAQGDAARDAHLEWAIEFAREREAVRERTVAWFESFAREWPNMAAALDWALDRPDDRCALVAELGVFWLYGQRIADGVNYGLDTIERFAADPPSSWYRAVAGAASVVDNAALYDRLRPFVAAATEIARANDDQTAAARLELATLMKRVLDEGLSDEVLTAFEVLDERAALADAAFSGFNATMLPMQFLVFSGRIDEAAADFETPLRTSRIALIEGYAAILRGDFDRAANRFREAGELAANEAKQERVMVASYEELLEALTGEAIPAPGEPIDFADRVGFTGIWEILHAGARLRRVMRDRAWGDIGDLATRTFPEHVNGLRVEAMLLPALAAAGQTETLTARARTLAGNADRQRLPLPGIEARLVLAELELSVEHAHDALAAAAQHGLVLAQIDAIELLAILADHSHDAVRAARFKAGALAERDRIGYRFRWPSRDAAFENIPVPTGTQTDSLHDIVAYAQRGRGERRRPPFGWDALTPTELEVARHVAAGLTNPQVADKLHVATATIKTHVEHIYTKLGINSRAELAARVTNHE